MKTPRDLHVVRALAPADQLRDADMQSDLLGTLYGHFSVFNTWYEIDSWWEGRFLERIAPGSFAKTFAERRDQIVVNFDHGYDPVIGDKVLGGIDDLREDGTGAYYEVGLLDTSYNRDLAPALRRGLYGASFRFQTIRDEWNEEPGKSAHNPDGIPERTIRETRTFEFGPVTYPASRSATAALRSGVIGLTDMYYERMRSANPRHVEELAERVRSLRTPASGAAPTGTPEPGAASNPTATPDTAPAVHHLPGLSASARSRLLELPFLISRETDHESTRAASGR